MITKKEVMEELLEKLMEHYQSDELPHAIYQAFILLDTTLNGNKYDDLQGNYFDNRVLKEELESVANDNLISMGELSKQEYAKYLLKMLFNKGVIDSE